MDPFEKSTVVFASEDGKKKCTLTISMDTVSNTTQVEILFEPELEPGSKPELYAGLALGYIGILNGTQSKKSDA